MVTDDELLLINEIINDDQCDETNLIYIIAIEGFTKIKIIYLKDI